MSIKKENIESILKRIAESEGFVDFDSTFSAGSKKGDNFVGEITRVIISGQKSNGETGKLNLILKCGASGAQRREDFKNHIIFEREIYYYNNLAPTFRTFQQERGLGVDLIFSSYPKCFETIHNSETEEHMLVFEDLCSRGFEMWPKNEPSPVENIRIVMRTLAKFHAVSFAMKDQQPQLFKPYEEFEDLMLLFFKEEKMKGFHETNLKRTSDILDNPDHVEIYKDVTAHFVRYMEELIEDNRFAIICHGDCWNNNILFHKNELNKTDEISLIDWQIIRYCSPAIDLLYHIFTVTDKKMREQEYENLIKIYYDQLSLNIRSLGSDPEKLFTFDDLQSELKRCGNYAVIMSPMLIQISMTQSDDIVDLDELCEQDGNYDFMKTSTPAFEKAFKERMSDTIADLVDLGYYRVIDSE